MERVAIAENERELLGRYSRGAKNIEEQKTKLDVDDSKSTIKAKYNEQIGVQAITNKHEAAGMHGATGGSHGNTGVRGPGIPFDDKS
ncbi:hypothetical protein LIER_12749 [Lithospermum erythrorhizon]|uniref:Uncharacterized protein n=1 Tax=Lithospermum erythrorhizon TaxID=34254 RepID=A0AAV3PY44_LITER